MNRFTVAFLAALLAHGLAIYALSQVRTESPEVNVKQGRASIRMAFQAAAAAPELTETKKTSAGQEQTEEPEQEKKKEEPQPEEPREKSSSSEGVTSEPKPTKKDESSKPSEQSKTASTEQTESDTTTRDSKQSKQGQQKQENKEEQEQKENEEIKEKDKKNEGNKEKQQNDAKNKKEAPESVNTEGVEWVQDVDYRENPPPRYPTKARVLGIEGTVRLLVTIGAEGNPESVEIHEESGSYRLDEAARRAVRDWTFVPARDGGEPVRSKTIVPVTFSLEGQ